jgi:hypothetical protein
MIEDEMLESLILDGSVEPAGIDIQTGEMLYSFTNKLLELHPEVFSSMLDAHVRDVYTLWEKGFIEMDITSESPIVIVLPKSFIPEEISKLPINLQISLRQIIDLYNLYGG